MPCRCYWPCLCTTAAISIFNASSGLCQLCHGFSTGRFLFQSWASHHFVYYMFGASSDVSFLLSGAILDAIFTPGDPTIGVCTIATLWILPVTGICTTWWWSSAQDQVCTEWLLPPLPWVVRKPFCCSVQLFPSHPIYMVWHTALGAWIESLQIPLPSLHGEERSSFPGLVPSNDTVNSEFVVGIKPDDSGVVIGYQADKLTHTWSAEQICCSFTHLSWVHW